MRKRATIKEIAAKAGVNPSTVSRVLNNSEKYKISESVRGKVLKIMEELEYEPRHYAQSIKTGRTNTFGLILHSLEQDFASPTASLVWAAFCREAMRLGYTTTIMPLEDEDLDLQITKKIRAGVADGYLVGGTLVGPKTKEVITKNGMPAVCYISDRLDLLSKLSGIEAVYADTTPAMKKLAGLLKKRGIMEMATFGAKAMSETRNARFRKITESTGMRVKNISYTNSAAFASDWRSAFQAAKLSLKEIKQFKAVFCTSDLVALGLCDALLEDGVTPGKDIFIIGCDNIEAHSLKNKTTPFLTTIDKNESEIGRTMAQELDRRLKGDNQESVSLGVPSEVIIRDSFNPNWREQK